ncbi:MAG TPA: ADOP family duplicated permease [Vicinamibacterales bacterium]|nr:ADOP family duplicated permease [Vicinamibacterales bacterium]
MVLHTLRMAMRALRRRPGFSAVAVATIALGAGTNAAVGSAAYGILLKPLPFAEPDRVVAVWPGRFMSQVDLRYLRERAAGLDAIAAVAPGWTFAMTGAGDPSRITVDRVSGNLFELLGARPYLGRLVRSGDERPGSPRVLALTYRFWRTRFGGDPAAVGRTVRLDDVPHEIVAVMPPGFEVMTPRTDAWSPLPADRAAFYDRLNFSLLIGRLADGVTVERADGAFRALMPAMRADLKYPASFGQTARIEDLRAATTGDVRGSVIVLGAAVAFMLLIAGANLGTLLIAGGISRAREFAVHAALGASRGALVRLQVAEGLLVTGAGAAIGVAVAAAAMPAVVRLLPRDTPRIGEIRVDAVVAGAIVCAAIAVAMLCAILPAIAAGRRRFGTLLREGASSESSAARRARGVMVAVQIALALVLTIGAGLMTRTLMQLNRVDAGIDVDRLLTLRVQPAGARYREPAAIGSYYDLVLERIGSVPGVQRAGAIQHLPFSGINWVEAYEVEGQPLGAAEARPTANVKLVRGAYFEAVGQPLLAGRVFGAIDRAATRAGVIVNRAFAQRHFGGAAGAVGRRIRTGRTAGPWTPIVGVVGDVHTAALDVAPAPEFYRFADGSNNPALMLAVRTSGDPLAVAAAVREAVWSVDRGVPIAELQTMRALVGTTLGRPRLLAALLTAFAAAGLALGGIGVYGIVRFAVTRRRREIGIRMALGADRASVVRLMLRETAGYAAAGVIGGTAIAAASSRVLEGLLFGVAATDPLTYGALAAAVAALVALASYAPARRAAAIAPAEALRTI